MENSAKDWQEFMKNEGLDRDLKVFYIQALLRSKLIGKLIRTEKKFSQHKRVIFWIILEYLDSEKCLRGLKAVSEDCDGNSESEQKVLEYFNIQEKPEGSFLKYLVDTVKNLKDSQKFIEREVQTEISFTEGIELKMKELEKEFERKKSLSVVDYEEKMIKFQKICEENAKNLVKSQVERIRFVEIESVKVEEASKFREQLQAMKNSLERNWESHIQRLKSKKLMYKTLLSQQKSEFSSILQAEQEEYANKIESMKNSHQLLKSSLESELSQAVEAKNSYQMKNLALDAKLNDLELAKKDLSSKFNAECQRNKLRTEQKLAEERSKLIEKETELELRAESLSKKLRSGQVAQEELQIVQGKLEESQTLLANLKEDYEKTIKKLEETQTELNIIGHVSQRDLDIIARQGEEIKILKGEIEMFREIFEQVRRKNKELESNYQNIVQQMIREISEGKKEEVDRESYWRIKEFCADIEKEAFFIKKEMGILIGDTRLHAILSKF